MVSDFLFSLGDYIFTQVRNLFSLNIFLGIIGRILYILSFLYSRFIVFKFQKDKAQNDLSPYLLQHSSGLSFWARFIGKELLFILLSIPFDFGAIFILGYSVLKSRKTLKMRRKDTQINLFFEIFTKFLSEFIFPLLFLGGLSYLIYMAHTTTDNIQYILDIFALLLSGVIYLLVNWHVKNKIRLYDYLHNLAHPIWNRMRTGVKVGVIVLIILVPSTLYGVVFTQFTPKSETFWMEMRDGTELRSRVYYPNNWNGKKLPTILMRTPYSLEGAHGIAINYVIRKDLIVVTQDIRGTPPKNPQGQRSEGEFTFFLDEAADGVDCINWIEDQSWYNGKIGTVGSSALAITQMCLHPEDTGGLKVAEVIVGSGELYDYCYRIGGCLRLGLARDWLPGVRGEDWQNEVDKILQHPLKNEFYENVSFELGNRYENINVRALHVGGWYDMFCQGTIDGYEKYNMGSDYASDHQLLVMGPWFHGFTNEHEDLTYPEQGHDEGMELINSLEATLFGEYLKDEIVDWETLPRVYYYVMGDPEHANSTKTYNEWRTAEEWPVSHTPESWYFHPNGTLSPHKPTQGEYVSYLYDPRDPVPNGGGTTLTLDYIGAVDQRRVEYETSPYDENEEIDAGWSAEDRSDILKFESPVLTEPVEFVGNISADLYVKSNCTDTDFTVKLMDVYPDGREMWVADGILKARFREGFQQETFLNPGQPYRLNIDMWSSAYRFVPGHKIKISISSSNWDKFAINPNTGGEIDDLYPANFTRDGFEFNIANNSIACGLGEKESCLWLPRTN